MPQKPYISVIVPSYCRPLSLQRCIASLACQEFPRCSFEVIIIDDGSEPIIARHLFDDLLAGIAFVLVRQENQGAAAARATGISRARGEILAFIDDDCTVQPDYLTAIETVFARHPETVVVQVGLHNPVPANVYGQAWKFALDQTLKINVHPASNGRLTCGILGGVMVARRQLFDCVSYEPRFRSGREDADLRYQLQKLSIPVYYEPTVRVFHHYRQSLRSCLATFFAYGRGEFHLQAKWRDIPSPVRRANLISWPAINLLIRSQGLVRGTAVYWILWLERNACLWGVLYEKTASCGPLSLRWVTFGSLLFVAYAAHAASFCAVMLKRVLRWVVWFERTSPIRH